MGVLAPRGGVIVAFVDDRMAQFVVGTSTNWADVLLVLAGAIFQKTCVRRWLRKGRVWTELSI